MAIDRQALFNEIANAKTSGTGIKIRDGKYIFVLKKVMMDKLYSGTYFIVEFIVKHATKVVVNELNEPYAVIDVEPNAVGTTCSVCVEIGGKNKSAAGNIKALFMGLVGETDESKVDAKEFQEMLDKMTSTAQPGRGMYIRCETYRKPIKSGVNIGKAYVGQNWSAVDQTPEQYAAERKALDAMPEEKAA